MKNVLVGMLLASVFIVPAMADGHRGGGGGSGGGSGGGGSGSGSAASTSSSTATGGAGGAGGSAAGGSATGGSATGGSGGAATGGNASGNTSTVSVSLTSGGSGVGASGSAAGDPAGTSTVKYDGSYTVKSAPPIAAPSLTSTFSDTCMGSSSFGLSFVGFGATGGTTMVDEACVRRLDSREFRAMGLNDVALALLCQSAANKKAVESAGHACPSASGGSDTAKATQVVPVSQQASLTAVEAPQPAPAPQPQVVPQAAQAPQAPLNVATAESVPVEPRAEAVEMTPLSDNPPETP